MNKFKPYLFLVILIAFFSLISTPTHVQATPFPGTPLPPGSAQIYDNMQCTGGNAGASISDADQHPTSPQPALDTDMLDEYVANNDFWYTDSYSNFNASPEIYCMSGDTHYISVALGWTESYKLYFGTGLRSQAPTAGHYYSATLYTSTPPPTVSLNASPPSISTGQNSALTWSSNFATACTSSGFSTEGSLGNTISVSPSTTTNYSITCTGAGGTSAPATATVTVTQPPTIGASCSVAPPTSTAGDTVNWTANFSGGTPPYNYTWSGTNLSGNGTTNGSTATQPATYTSAGTMNGNIAVVDSGTGAGQQTISNACDNSEVVSAAPVVSDTLSANDININSGDSTTLNWTSSNATSCSIDNGVGTVTPTAGGTTSPISPTTNTTYTITCQGPSGPATASASVTVNSIPDVYATNPTDVSGLAGDTLNLSATIGTSNSIPTGAPFSTTFWVNNSPSQTGATAYEYPSGGTTGYPGNHSEVDTYSGIPFPTAGTYYYQVCGDEDQFGDFTVPDSDHSNNCTSSWATITISPQLPNLTPISLTPLDPVGGTPVSFTGTIQNSGLVWSGNFPSELLLCPTSDTDCIAAGNTYIAGAETLRSFSPLFDTLFTYLFHNAKHAFAGTLNQLDMSTIDIPNGSSGTNTSLTTFTFPNAGGQWQYTLCADSPYTTAVSSKASLCSKWTTFTVTPAPQVSCLPDPNTAVAGEPVTWTASSEYFSGAPTYTWSSGEGSPANGTGTAFSSSYPSPGNYAATVTGTYGAESVSATCVPAVTVTVPTVSLTATPDRVQPGTTGIVLSWTGSGFSDPTDLCTLTGSDGLAVSGLDNGSAATASYTDPNTINTQTNYTISCITGPSGNHGTNVQSTAIVNVVPKFVNF